MSLGKCAHCKVEIIADLPNRCRDKACPGLPVPAVQIEAPKPVVAADVVAPIAIKPQTTFFRDRPLSAEERQAMYAARRTETKGA
jgi:hypothetical protein